MSRPNLPLLALLLPLAALAQGPIPANQGGITQAQLLRAFPDPNAAPAPTPPPPTIGGILTANDISGQTQTLVSTAPVQTATNAFFQSLGSNGRACATCHTPQSGWGMTPQQAQAIFAASNGGDPLFRRFDGAVCPTADMSTPAAMKSAYALLLNRGLIRVGVTIPTNAEFTVPSVVDPYNCTTSPTTGLTSPSAGVISVYRRPLPTANLRFETTLMWDGREPTLTSQATDATLIHAQAFTAPTAAQLTQMVGFELALTAAQSNDNAAGSTGSPASLAAQAVTGPDNAPFPSNAFTVFQSWASLTGGDAQTQARQSIARGEAIFNTRPMQIAGVAGFNNTVIGGHAVGGAFTGACSTCHDVVNSGNNSKGLMLDIGVTTAGGVAAVALNAAGLPQFTLTCISGNQAGRRTVVTDPGAALITGKCADIGKTKVPALRNLAARGPYFHNGSAGNLRDVVNFYDRRFRLGLSQQEVTDLVNFLSAL